MKIILTAFISGLVFALGLGVSGMTQPQNIIAFLNLAGNWNPALILVMASAVFVSAFGYLFVRKLQRPLVGAVFSISPQGRLTLSLVVGSVLFGLGWGLAGYCPGPALVALVTFRLPVVIFVVSMFSGQLCFKAFDRKKTRSHQKSDRLSRL